MALISRQKSYPEAQRYVLHISSADRDIVKYPSASDYAIDLPTRYRNVKMMTMLSPEFCNEQYVISESNNALLVNDAALGGIDTIVTIPSGSYTPTSLAAALVIAIDATAVITGVTTIVYNTDTRKYTISNSGAGIALLIAASQDVGTINNNLIWGNLGFLDKSSTPIAAAAGATSIVSTGVVNLKRDAYLMLEIVDRNIATGRMDSTGQHATPFAKIIFDPTSTTTTSSGVYSFVPMAVTFSNISVIKYLKFSVRRPNGDYVDHNGVEHSFTLEFVCSDGSESDREYPMHPESSMRKRGRFDF